MAPGGLRGVHPARGQGRAAAVTEEASDAVVG
jgi:hypothetical protein